MDQTANPLVGILFLLGISIYYIVCVVWSYISIYLCYKYEMKAFGSVFGDKNRTLAQEMWEGTFASILPIINMGVIMDCMQHYRDAKHYLKTGEEIIRAPGFPGD